MEIEYDGFTSNDLLDIYAQRIRDKAIKDEKVQQFKLAINTSKAYTCKHIPTGETWWIIGWNFERNRISVAGWPPTIAEISDLDFSTLVEGREINEQEIAYRKKEFLCEWD